MNQNETENTTNNNQDILTIPKIGGGEYNAIGTPDGNAVTLEAIDMGEAWKNEARRTNYISLEDYSKMGTINIEALTRIKQDDFYEALMDVNLLCKRNTRYIPCETTQNNHTPADYGEGEELEFFKKGKKGYWGFRFDRITELIERYGVGIVQYANQMDEEREAETALAERNKFMAARRNMTVQDLQEALLQEEFERIQQREREETQRIENGRNQTIN